MTENSLKKAQTEQKWLLPLFAVVSFLCLYVFFTKAHPLYIHDLDDWYYLMCGRHGLPSVNQWNPARVLPETWMPMMAYLASYLVYPITGDWVEAISGVFAATLALTIVVYALMTGKLLKHWFQVGSVTEVLLLTIFLLGHFLPFILDDAGNVHLFYAHDVSCIFYYILPALLNFILCGYYLTQDPKKLKPLARGALILAVYLAIFSNLFQSIILMSLFGIQLFFALVEGLLKNKQEKKPLLSGKFIKEYLARHYEKILWILLWFVSMAFEISGARAKAEAGGIGVLDAMRAFRSTILNMNPIFHSGVVVVNLVALALAGYRWLKKKETAFLYLQLCNLCCMGLTALYLALLCTKVGLSYLIRPDVMISWMGWLLLMTIASLAYVVKALPKAAYVLPLILYLLLFETAFHSTTYAEYNVSGMKPAIVKAVNDDILAQVKAAEEAGQNRVEVLVPASMSSHTWPLDTELTGERIAAALFGHGITGEKLEIIIVPSPEKDAEFHLD